MMLADKDVKTHHFGKETHGKRDDIDENTSLDDVKAPNLFQRAKEEIEALVETIHHKKDSQTHYDQRLESNIFLTSNEYEPFLDT